MGEADTPGDERFAGPYRLLARIGRGGFGEVFLGEAPDGTRAAVKLLHASWAGDGEMRGRFAAEVDQARKVGDFCVAAILDADPGADQPWIASEHIDGPTLETAVREQGPRRGADLHRLAVATATALAAIHGAGVVHRDLKPDNILLAADGPRVIDFGIARAVEATSMTASGVIGTIGYMAPEQLEGARLGPAVDVFSWGAVLVYAATGREAFSAPTQAARTTRVLTGEPDTGDLADPLLSVALACLDKDPAHRPSARTLLDMLLGARPSDAPPEAARPGASAGEARPGGDGATERVPSAAGDTAAADAATRSGPDRTRVEAAPGEAATRIGPEQTRVETGAERNDPAGERTGTLLYTSLAPDGAAEGAATQVPDAPPLAWPPGPAPASPAPAPSPGEPVGAHPQAPPAGASAPGGPSATGPGAGHSGRIEGPAPPYWFAQGRYTDAGDLAEAMQRNWSSAVHVFSDAEERAALGSWMVDDLGDTATDRSIYRRRPDDANRAVAWFVAQLRPDLPPVFRGRPASLADLRSRFAGPRAPFTGAPPDNELVLLARPDVLNVLALHAGPDAAELRRLADALGTAERAAVDFRTRLERAVPRLAQRAAVDSALILSLLLHDRSPAPDADGRPEVAEWYGALWSAVEREQGAARVGASAAAASAAGEARDSALRSAEWAAALAQAERERDAAAERWQREARLFRADKWGRRIPFFLLALPLLAYVADVASGAHYPESGDGPIFILWLLIAWVVSRVVSWAIHLFSGPRNGFRHPVQAAQARFHTLRDHAVRVGQGAEQMRGELEAVRRLGRG
ncbi:serine/threonine-protein kinase [Streptomonospora litoralis]|uniref:non-specific serine/threonine protein kinase n=1 Tax=Streptomonospora litoralis TaxID=2498135 RepID=A0A4P6Q721_9ACTN|nr:serine/threonine-protein kinase [Streptomonospora litoralis]QBI54724.1 Serine/threonine-protein kinase AfsK [Streptomonospora litoralis]